jgi:hypothetical protein
MPVHRLGLSASYRPGKKTIYEAIDAGVNYFFGYGIDTQMTGVLREVLRHNRENFVFATGAYNYIFRYQNIRRPWRSGCANLVQISSMYFFFSA